MALTKKRRYRNNTMRRSQIGPSTKAQSPMEPPIVPTALVHSASTIAVTFPVAIIYSGILPGWTNNSQHVTGVSVTGANTATLTFSGVTAAGAVTVPFQDPAFRSITGGGYVASGSYTAT